MRKQVGRWNEKAELIQGPPVGAPLTPFSGQHVWRDMFRYYSLPDGHQFAGVTTILAATKTPRDKAKLDEWRKRVGEFEANLISHRATDRGTGMHAAAEARLTTQPVVIADVAAPYWESIQHVFPMIIRPYLVEGVVWHPYGFAGSTDLVAHVEWPGIVGGVPVVLDWKTSDKVKKEGFLDDYRCQTAGYCAAVNRLYGHPYGGIKHGMIVIAVPGQEAQIIRLAPWEMKHYWDLFKKRVAKFHQMMREV